MSALEGRLTQRYLWELDKQDQAAAARRRQPGQQPSSGGDELAQGTKTGRQQLLTDGGIVDGGP
jgi:hypothetical protein